jgi:diketogulonate reductase-like aldo/keto reductase
MPVIGLGVWKTREGEEVIHATETALSTGYRLIDTATLYRNEKGVGQAIRQSKIDRKDIFVTTKLWNDSHQYDRALRAFDTSMEKLGLDYLDLYLIHWPAPQDDIYLEAWRALERLYDEKRVRAIGVSNFEPHHLEKLLAGANVVPTVNQIELNPFIQQHETRQFCARHDIKIESWGPIMRGKESLNDPRLARIAEKHRKTTAQVVIRWHIESGFIVIPKSVHAERIRENFDVFDFELDELDMRAIGEMDASRPV